MHTHALRVVVPAGLKAKAARLVGAKCTLLARIDAYGQDPEGQVGLGGGSGVCLCCGRGWEEGVCLCCGEGGGSYAVMVRWKTCVVCVGGGLGGGRGGGKCTLLVRIDAYGQDPEGQVGLGRGWEWFVSVRRRTASLCL